MYLAFFWQRAQPLLQLHAPRELRIHLDAVMQITLARGLRLLERGFRILHQLVCLASVVRKAGDPTLDLGGDLAAVDAEGPCEGARDVLVQGANFAVGTFA